MSEEIRALGDMVLLNPCRGLKKGLMYPFVEMANAACSNRHPLSTEQKAYDKGTAFDEGDTLIACIEPCLEHGKGFRAEGTGTGFASREFVALRPATDALDSMYLYYMMESPAMRNALSLIMTGTKGRRRVDRDKLMAVEVRLPPLSEQQRTKEILMLLDDAACNLAERSACAQKLIKSAWAVALTEAEPRTVKLFDMCSSIRKYVDCSEAPAEALYIASEHMRRGSLFAAESGRASDMSGSRPAFAKGDVLLPRIRPENRKAVAATGLGATAESVEVLRPNCADYEGALIMAVSSEEFVACATLTACKGTVMQRTDVKRIGQCRLTIPGGEALQRFNSLYRDAAALCSNAVESLRQIKCIKELTVEEKFKGIVVKSGGSLC